MKLFGWKAAGRDGSRPALSRSGGGVSALGEWPRSYEAQVREAYLGNPIAQRAVKLVAEGAGSAPLAASSPELEALVAARSGGQPLIETLAAYLLLHGNAYVQVLSGPDGEVAELFALRPERVVVEPDASGWPAAYRYRVGEQVTRLSADPVRPEVVHLKSFNPVDDHYGLGCLGAAAGAVAIHNAAARWSKALLDNAARPSGALVYEPGDGSSLSADQFERLKAEMEAGFAGAGNAGRPMLTELSVQTSSYGSPIPKQFGTMRIAGSVIWSTDLIESKTKSSGGKGQPDTVNYSYSVSFAVLLSARAILSVKRIWADGNLLRGAAGDFKTSTGFRLYPGDEAQDMDPLIASAEGATLTPAHRGCAYVVLENFQLADYGNRIPSLTFEVEADAAPVTAGQIAATIGDGLVADGGVSLPIAGFSAYGDSVSGVLGTLATASGGWFEPAGTTLVMRCDGAAGATIEDAGFAAAAGKGTRRTRSIAAIETVPKTITIGYYDPARDYQTGLQHARRPGAGSTEQQVDMPAVLSSGAAKTIAQASLARAETGRETRSVALGWSDLAVAPGDVVAIAGENGRWRATGWSLENMVLTLSLVRLASASLPATASSGRVLATPDLATGTTIVHAFEAPPLDDNVLNAPRLLIVAAGTAPGWRKAALLLSLDGGARWTNIGATGAPAVIGTVASVPGIAAALLIDRINSFEVDLAHSGMTLADADNMALDAGANLALVGDELLQFGAAEQIGETRWRLSGLWRGRRGTEMAIDQQGIGDRFTVIDKDNVTVAQVPLSMIGASVRVLASGVGDLDGPAACDAAITGASVVPPSPAHLAVRMLNNDDAALGWIRRSRAGWGWIDGIDAPLVEERELYRATITPSTGAVRIIDTSVPALTIAAADRGSGPMTVAVRQVGSNGESAPASDSGDDGELTMNDDSSARLKLPLLQPGQAQKEMTHNEALARLDLAVQAAAVSFGEDIPPTGPAPGDCWIVGDTPTGDWAGMAGAIAGWTTDGWRFVAPAEGTVVWITAQGVPARFAGGGWTVGDLAAKHVSIGGVPVLGEQAAAIADPAGGTVTDSEARATLTKVLDALRSHGLIAT